MVVFLFLSLAQITLHQVLKHAGLSTSNGWGTMLGFCGVYFLFATMLEGNSSGGCLGGIGYAMAGMGSFCALLTQLVYLLFNYSTSETVKNETEHKTEHETKNEAVPEINKLLDDGFLNKLLGGDFWV
jgi:hypothetical protein